MKQSSDTRRAVIVGTIKTLTYKLSRNPTVKELAAEYGCSIQYLYWLLPQMQAEGLVDVWPKTVSVREN
jgi:hypothetical protein